MATNLFRDRIDTVIYHHPCSDGFGAALVMWLHAQEHSREIQFIPGEHGTEPPNVTGKHVLLCDFAYKLPQMQIMVEQATDLLIIDHHATAVRELQDLPAQHKLFEMEHSGATLTWSYIFPDREVPLLLQYIEDQDLGRWKLPLSDQFRAWFYNLVPFEFEEYAKYLDDSYFMEMVKERGQICLGMIQRQVEIGVENSIMKSTMIGGQSYQVVYVNSTALKSEIGRRLLELYPVADLAAIYSYNDREDRTYFSLRSEDTRADVGMIAALLGGGGHRNASGFILPGVVSQI